MKNMFTYNGSTTKIYPNVIVDDAVLVAVPGQSYNVSTPLDGDWSNDTAPKDKAQEPVTTPEAPVEASDSESTPTPTN
jgi:hypothetical protein